MKPGIFAILLGSFIAAHSVSMAFAAESASQVDRVVMKNGNPSIEVKGEFKALKEELQLNPTISVQTNGTFTVNQSDPRKLSEGQILRKDGTLLNPDGTIVNVQDHAVMLKGKVWIYKDGNRTPLTRVLSLPNGTRITPSGEIHLANGQFRRMIEGQQFKLSGEALPSKDTVTLRDGRVYVQKEGTQFPIRPNQTIMMNDGTKVYGSGKLERRDGTVQTLTEGQVVLLPGVVPNR